MVGYTSLLAWLLLVVPAASSSSSSSTASSTKPTPTVYDPAAAAATATSAAATGSAARYRYHGCIHEITGLNGTEPGARALQYGINEVLPGAMTVPQCLAFCGGGSGSGTTYNYAGLEYARECWCGTRVSVLATAADDADCALPCDGDATMQCGGNLRLSLYQMPSATATGGAALRHQVGTLAVALAGAAAFLPFI